MAERLHKYLASCGVGSRRACEGLIQAGRVTVDGSVVAELGFSLEPAEHEVRVDGDVVVPEPTRYLVVHKPVGYVSSTKDERGIPSVLKLAGQRSVRLFIAGRLDVDSEGLLLLTNDGEVTDLLTHARYGVPKTYRVTVNGELTWRQLRKLRDGLELEDGPASAIAAEPIRVAHGRSKADVTVVMGRKRMVRRMFQALGYEVVQLRRVSMGLLKLGRLPKGSCRRLTPAEMDYILKLRLYRSHQEALEHVKGKGERPHALGHRHR
jgi:pseudouridine synthase